MQSVNLDVHKGEKETNCPLCQSRWLKPTATSPPLCFMTQQSRETQTTKTILRTFVTCRSNTVLSNKQLPLPAISFQKNSPSAAENAFLELSIPMKRGMLILQRI